MQRSLRVVPLRPQQHDRAAVEIRAQHIEDARGGVILAVFVNGNVAFELPRTAHELRRRPCVETQFVQHCELFFRRSRVTIREVFCAANFLDFEWKIFAAQRARPSWGAAPMWGWRVSS